MVDTDLTLFFARFAWANTETTEDIWNKTRQQYFSFQHP